MKNKLESRDIKPSLDKSEEKKEVQYIKLCPKCNSVNVNLNQKGGLAFFGLPAFYTCKNCGYTNNFFPEIEIDEVDKLNVRKRE